jgi:hypothetical protein
MNSRQRRIRDRKLANAVLCMVDGATSSKLAALRMVQTQYMAYEEWPTSLVNDMEATTLAGDQ